MEAILEEMESNSEVVVEEITEEEPAIVIEKTVDAVEEIVEEISRGTPEPEIIEVKPAIVIEETVDVVEEIIEEISWGTPEPEILKGDSSALDQLLRSVGLSEEADMLRDNGDIDSVRRVLSSHVGVEPRDMRLDRLLRLSLRLIPKGDDGDDQRDPLLATLADLAGILSKWTRTRLEARHNGAKGILLEDAAILGHALERIPGPGTPMPLDADDYELPKLDDIDGLTNEVDVLKRRVLLANSGGVR
jgi:polyhydroxyalkanoate synthesis regulator phasin